MSQPKPLTFDEWNTGKKGETELLVPPVYQPVTRGLDITVWTADVQRLETFRRQCLVQKPPYKQPGWRPKK